MPSQISEYGRLVKVELAQHLTFLYLATENQNEQIVEISTADRKTLQKLGYDVGSLRDVMAFYGKPDVSEGSLLRYECDMNFGEFSAARSESLAIRIGSHAD